MFSVSERIKSRDENDIFFHLQVIGAEDVLQGIETFGWSMSGAVDMDLNQYPGKMEKNLMKDIASIPYEPRRKKAYLRPCFGFD